MEHSFQRVAFDSFQDREAIELYAEIRREVFDEDCGQNSWMTAKEQDGFLEKLELRPGARVLDVASGSGGPALRLARRARCQILGIDVVEQRVDNANAAARDVGLTELARFRRLDASRPLPFGNDSFDAIVCVDAISAIPRRKQVLTEWHRVLEPGGRAIFTDAAVVTGPVSDRETELRSSMEPFFFARPAENQRLILEIGLELVAQEDTTSALGEIADRWRQSRATRADRLRAIEGKDVYEGQQEFFAVTALAAREQRLSRFVYLIRKPAQQPRAGRTPSTRGTA